MNPDNDEINRRDFLIRAVKAGICITSASCGTYYFYNDRGPLSQSKPVLATGGLSRVERPMLPDFSIEGLGHKMSIVNGSDRSKTIRLALKALGGMETFIKRGDRVLIKVNAAFATPPFLGATTHPQLVAEVVHLCLEAGASFVAVTDNPINDPVSCFNLTGISQAAESAGAKVVLPKESLFKTMSVSGATLIQNWPILYRPFENINKLIGVTPVKHHQRSGASMSMKNWYGLLGGRRNIFHQNIHQIIQELAMMIKPTLVILDGTVTMMQNGPTGGSLADLKQTNTMIVSTDQVAADAFGATLMGKTHLQFPYILKAQMAGVGTCDYQSLNPTYLNAD